MKSAKTDVGNVLRVIDPLLAGIAGWLAYKSRLGEWLMPQDYLLAVVLGVLLTVFLFPIFRLYHARRGQSIAREIYFLAFAWTAVCAALVVLAGATKTSEVFSRLWFGFWYLTGGSILMAFHLSIHLVLIRFRKMGYNTRRIVIAGGGELAAEAHDRLKAAPWTGYEIVGYFDAGESAKLPSTVPRLGDICELGRYVENGGVDQVWIALPWDMKGEIVKLLPMLRYSTIDIRLVQDIFHFQLLNSTLTEVAGIPMVDLCVSPLRDLPSLAVKTILDYLMSILVVILLIPLMGIIAACVKMSSRGPVLFRQKRHGIDGRPVEIWKFRTMKEHGESPGTVTQASADDHRVTRFGSWLRKTSLDELPQFFNVLQGRMSIVGPRPHAVEHNDEYKRSIDRYMLRHKVKPGITGWAQVNGLRGETRTPGMMAKRIEYDLHYLEHWSFWFDIRIILLTVVRGFWQKNAW